MATDEIVIRFSVNDDGSPKIEKLNQALAKTKTASQSLLPGFEKARKGVTGFISENAGLIAVLAGVGIAVKKMIGEYMEYASAVRLQANLSGQSAEEASRYIQVLDDYKISTQEALQATRALTNSGHAPSIETLAKLSDEYLKINGVEEKNAFILKNLGRGGVQWVEMLGKGSKALLEQGAAVDKNLILSQKMIDQVRLQEISVHHLTDTWAGFTYFLSSRGFPTIRNFTDGLNVYLMAITDSDPAHRTMAESFEWATKKLAEEEQAMLATTDATDGLAESQEKAGKAAKTLTDIYTGLLSSMFSIQSTNDSYQQSVKDMAQKDRDLAAEKEELIAAMDREKQAGKLTSDEYANYISKLKEVGDAQRENAMAKIEAEEENKKAAQQRVYDLAQQKLAADGVVTSGEYEYLQNLAVQYGLVTQETADQAIAEEQRAEALVSSFEQTLPPAERTLQTLRDLAALNGTVVDFSVNYHSNAPQSFTPQTQYAALSAVRDEGGSGMAGTPYEIGVPEVFVPHTGGEFIPLHGADNKIGTTNNINISIGSIRSQQDMAYLAQEIKRRLTN